jgi:tRNA_anti-like
MPDQRRGGETKHITPGIVVSWLFLLLFIAGGAIDAMGGTVIAGVFGILIGVALLPSTSKLIKDKLNLSFSGGLKFVAVVLLMIVGGSLQVAHGTSNTAPTATINVTAAANTPAPPPTPTGPPIAITAAALHAAYSANAVAADATYKGKVVQVTGTIDTISTDILGNPFVALKTGEYSAIEVQCTFAQSDKQALTALASGQTVTLEGTVQGEPLNISIDGCSIAK